ncbi:MAG TPA: class III extradiol ring-cleavage dioxygenase [Stellaceae bacterium]
MPDPKLPSIFVSHGAPTLALDAGETGAAWQSLAGGLPRPKAVLCVSAHWTTAAPTVSGPARNDTIHDFHGFPAPLYQITYPAPGDPALAERVARLLSGAGMTASIDRARGLDHGAWVPLRLMYPEADVPTIQLSVQPGRDAAWHYRIGEALQPLRAEGVLILGSGGAVHNLREVAWEGGPAPAWAQGFDDWLAAMVAEGRAADLLDWRRAPHARQAQPTDEHFLPLFVALGAAGKGARGERLHQGFTLGSMSMAAFKFAA